MRHLALDAVLSPVTCSSPVDTLVAGCLSSRNKSPSDRSHKTGTKTELSRASYSPELIFRNWGAYTAVETVLLSLQDSALFVIQHIYAGGMKDANKAPWIVAYSTMNTTTPPANRDVLPSHSCPASQRYHSGYADAILVMI